MKKYIKIFLVVSLGFGIIWTAVMGLLYWIIEDPDVPLQSYLRFLAEVALIAGFTFGFVVAIPLMIIDHLSIRKFKDKKEASKTRVKRQVIVSLNYDDTFDRAKEALSLMEAKIIKEDKEAGIIAKTGVSWKSWGEILTINFKRLSDNQTQVEILSVPKIRTAIVDGGKNYENVERFCNKMRR